MRFSIRNGTRNIRFTIDVNGGADDTNGCEVIERVDVGIDPVSLAVRPDGKEVWVSNHVSDTVSVVDVDPASPTRYQVIATVTAWSEEGFVTDFDEPVAFVGSCNLARLRRTFDAGATLADLPTEIAATAQWLSSRGVLVEKSPNSASRAPIADPSG